MAAVGDFPSVYGCGEEGDEEGGVPISQANLQVCVRDECSCSRISAKKVVIAKGGWQGGRSEPASTADPSSTRNQWRAVTPKPCCPADRALMTNGAYPWQPGLRHCSGCQPSHHAAILQRGVMHRPQCLLWRWMWLEVLSRMAIFVLPLLHSWTAGSGLWQSLREVQHGLWERSEQWNLHERSQCPDQVIKFL